MSDVIDAAVEALNDKISGGFDGIAKFEIPEEGAIIIDANGAREGDEDADVTLIADADVFQSILSGDLGATAAFMTGKLRIEGDMGQAMKLGSVLS